MLIPLIHFIATAMMAGLIWFVQVVHYPLFSAVGHGGFIGYEAAHQRRTGFVVGPLMLIEMLTALALLIRTPADVPAALPAVGVAMLVVIWLSTAFLQVPAHRRLQAGYDGAAHRRLLRTNWLRTALWTARTPLAAAMLAPRAC